jgi:transcriptional regulator with XRE-family HTH domain
MAINVRRERHTRSLTQEELADRVIRLRKRLSGVWENELFGSAAMLTKEIERVGK